MVVPQINFSDDQAEAFDAVAEILRSSGIDLEDNLLTPLSDGQSSVAAVIGKAGSGKTLLLAQLYHALRETNMKIEENVLRFMTVKSHVNEKAEISI